MAVILNRLHRGGSDETERLLIAFTILLQYTYLFVRGLQALVIEGFISGWRAAASALHGVL
jgi:hypothetical protein